VFHSLLNILQSPQHRHELLYNTQKSYEIEIKARNIINCLDPIEELYKMYLEEEKTPRIVKLVGNRLGLDSDIEDGLANLYLKL